MWETLNIIFIFIGNIFDYYTAEQKQPGKKKLGTFEMPTKSADRKSVV